MGTPGDRQRTAGSQTTQRDGSQCSSEGSRACLKGKKPRTGQRFACPHGDVTFETCEAHARFLIMVVQLVLMQRIVHDISAAQHANLEWRDSKTTVASQIVVAGISCSLCSMPVAFDSEYCVLLGFCCGDKVCLSIRPLRSSYRQYWQMLDQIIHVTRHTGTNVLGIP